VSWWKRGALGTMTDESAKKARLMRVMDVMIEELQRQGLAEVLSNLNFDPRAMAEVMIKAADGEVVPFPSVRQDR
jgi:hypothetical protein